MKNRCLRAQIGSLNNIGFVFAQTPFGLTTTKVDTENALYTLKNAKKDTHELKGDYRGIYK